MEVIKFKTGDKVIVSNIEEEGLEHLVGKEAIVINVSKNNTYPIEIRLTEDSSSINPELFKENELRLKDSEETLKNQFHKRVLNAGVPKVLIVCVLLPSGAVETIINTQDTVAKASYYLNNYDEEFKLKNNPNVQIIGFTVA